MAFASDQKKLWLGQTIPWIPPRCLCNNSKQSQLVHNRVSISPWYTAGCTYVGAVKRVKDSVVYLRQTVFDIHSNVLGCTILYRSLSISRKKGRLHRRLHCTRHRAISKSAKSHRAIDPCKGPSLSTRHKPHCQTLSTGAFSPRPLYQ